MNAHPTDTAPVKRAPRRALRFAVTVFPDQHAMEKRQSTASLTGLTNLLSHAPTEAMKGALPWLKLATFGDKPTEKGCLRHDDNVLTVTGIEGDYDDEQMSLDEAERRLRALGVQCLLYTSPSYKPDAPRWRVLAPLSKAVTGTVDEMREQRTTALKRIDAALGGVLATESYTLSQSYFFGSVRSGHPVEVRVIRGRYVDELPDQQVPPEPDDGRSDTELVACIVAGEGRHEALVRLAARYTARGMPRKAVEDTLYGLLDGCAVPGDPNYRVRRAEIVRAIDSAIRKFGKSRDAGPPIVLRNLHDIVSNPTREEWLLKPYLERDVVAVVYGEAGTFKSFLVLDWALHIATGRSWHGTKAQPPACAILISAEGRGLHKRTRAWLKHHGMDRADLRAIPFRAIEMPLNLSDDERMRALVTAVDELGLPPALIVVDTLTKNSLGVEEDNSKMQAFLNRVNAEIRHRYRCTVILVHHPGWDSSHPRGPYSLFSNTEAMYLTKRQANSDTTIDFMTQRLKDSDLPASLSLVRRVIELGVDGEGERVSSVVLERSEVRVIPDPSNKRERNYRAAWEAFQSAGRRTYTETEAREVVRAALERAGVKEPRKRVREILERLKGGQWLKKAASGWGYVPPGEASE